MGAERYAGIAPLASAARPPVVTEGPAHHSPETPDTLQRISTLVGSAPVVLFNTDSELRYTWLYHANPDLHCAQPVGKKDSELLLDREEAQCLEDLKRDVLRTGQSVRANIHVTPRSRRYYYDLSLQPLRDKTGEICGVAGFAVDVTDQFLANEALRKAERALLEESRRREERQRMVGMATHDVIWDLDLSNNTVQWSEATTQVLGYAPEEIPTRQHWINLIHPDDRYRVLASGDQAIQSAATRWLQEYRIICKDGRCIVVLDRIVIARDEMGRAYRVVGSMLDLTERRAAEQAMALAKAEAEAASDAKGQFLAVLSHELRTPLTPVLTASQILADEDTPKENVREMAAIIRRNVELEMRLIDDLLDHTRISRGKLQLRLAQTDLHEAIVETLELTQAEAQARGIRLALHLEAPQTTVLADAARLQQILWNLVKNAIKFTSADGSIDISTSSGGDGRICVSVKDTGQGIEPADLKRIFNAFEQGNSAQIRQSGGLGLGLAITKGLVELHGGKIAAHSDGPDTGATFAVTLPLHTGAADVAPPAPATSQVLPQRILLVEDDADTARLIARILRQRGHSVLTADTVAAALSHAAGSAYDILLSDIGLPDGSGLDLMRKLSEAGPVRGVVMSGYGLEDDLRRSREAGFQVHLTKPVTIQQLDAALAEVSRAQR